MKKQPTMSQIADELKMSRMTVSTVINQRTDQFPVAPKTQKRIRDYLDKIGYVRNFHAMNLKKRPKDVLGVYYDGRFQVHHVTEAFNRMMQLTSNHPNMGIEIRVAPPEASKVAIAELISRGTTHLIWCCELDSSEFINHETCRYLEYCKSVIYNVGNNERVIEESKKYPNLSLISFDRTGGHRKMANLLFQKGHRRVAVPQFKASDVRTKGNDLNFSNWGLETHFIHPEDLDYQAYSQTYLNLLIDSILKAKEDHGITAVVFGDDELAVHAIKGLSTRGIRVPEDLSVTGMDGEPWLQFLKEPLDTVGFPVEKAIRKIDRILFNKGACGLHSMEMELMPGGTVKDLN